MKSLIRITLLTLVFTGIVSAQEIRLAASYNRTDFPLIERSGQKATENVNGYTAEADVQVFARAGVRVSLAYNFKQAYNVEVFPDYFDGMNMVDLYRNVSTHSGGAQLGYTIKEAFEPFGALFYGTRKIHENAPRQIIRTIRFGANVPFHKESPIFVKAYVDRETPFGVLPIGFANPPTWTLGVGVGFRFGGRREYKAVPPETTPPAKRVAP